MSTERKQRNILMYLAAEGVVPVLGGCAGALIGGPGGGVVGLVVGQAVEKAINLFGKGIVEKWQAWFATATPEERAAAIAELAALPPASARAEAKDALGELAPDALPEDLAVALDYLTVLPNSVDRALVPEPDGGKSVPATITFHDPQALLPLLPQDVPPYPSSAELPGTPYRLVELVGSGGFGAVYRAVSPTLQHLPLAIKFCLDRSLIAALNLERSNLERLMRAGGDRGAAHVVRLYGYDLDHPTPYLVYEYVAGGDLTHYLSAKRAALGRALTAGEVLGLITQIAHGLAFAHAAGLVHRDVKPTNVLADGETLKLADFGLGGVAVRRAVERSRIGTTTIDYLSLAEQASLFRGAGTPLYMSPEQRRGANPDPRHDLYSLGVLWFQLLTGDVSRELHPGWAKELTVRYGVPASHIALIDRCVGWFDERPKDGGELVPLLREAMTDAPQLVISPEPPPLPVAHFDTARPEVTPASAPRAAIRKERLLDLLRELAAALAATGRPEMKTLGIAAGVFFALVFFIALAVTGTSSKGSYYGGVQAGYSFFTMIWIGLAFAIPFTAVFAGVLYTGLWFILSRRREAAIGGALKRLVFEFPAEVEVWGGLEQVSSPAVVAAVIEQVSRPGFLVSASRPADPPPEPAAIPVASVRKEELLARLRDLRAALRPPRNRNTWEHLPVILMVAIVTVLTTLALTAALMAGSHETERIPVVVITTVAFGILVPWVFANWLIGNARRRSEARVDRLAKRVRTGFAADVAAWGGTANLSDPAFVDAALKRVETADYEVRPPADPADPLPEPPSDPTRKAPPLWAAIPMSLVFAVTVGIAVGVAAYWVLAPRAVSVPSTVMGRPSETKYFAAGGGGIGQDVYRAKDGFANRSAAGAGIAVGLASLTTGMWWLSRRIRFVQPTLLALTAGYFLLGLPALVAGPLLADAGMSPHVSFQSGSMQSQFTSADGQKIEVGEYARQKWEAAALGHGLGLLFGIALPAALVALVRWRYREASGTP